MKFELLTFSSNSFTFYIYNITMYISAGIFKQSVGARVGIGLLPRTGPPHGFGSMESFLGPLKILKIGALLFKYCMLIQIWKLHTTSACSSQEKQNNLQTKWHKTENN